MRYLICLLSILFISYTTLAEDFGYYKLVSITQNGQTKTNVTGGQFIRFIGDICFECDKNGVGVGHGTGKLTSSDSQQITYKGGSYLGSGTYFKFTTNKNQLKIVNADASLIYTFTRSQAPAGVTTSSYIRSINPPQGQSQSSGNSNYVPVVPSTPSSTPSNTRKQHTCNVCKGTGKVIRLHYSAGQSKWCYECNKEVPTGHLHEMCTTCYGKGYLEY